MPISPISAAFDLDSFIRFGGPLVNCVDSGVNLNINLAGSDSDSWGGVEATGNSYSGIAAFDQYTSQGNVDWVNLILPIPNDAIITGIRMQARASSTISASCQNVSSGGTPSNDTLARINLRLRAASSEAFYTPIQDTIININDSNGDSGLNTDVSSEANSNSILLSKVWDFTSEPGGGISRTNLVNRFTGVSIRFNDILSSAGLVISLNGETNTGSANSQLHVVTNNWFMTVTWTYEFQWTMTPPDLSAVQEGDLVTITSSGDDALLLDQLEIEMGGVPVIPITQTPNEFTFVVPPGMPDLAPIIATGNGTQFSGTVPLGILQILIVEASGIYVLELGKSNDTLYVHNEDSVTPTTEIAIPNPFIETGLIGG